MNVIHSLALAATRDPKVSPLAHARSYDVLPTLLHSRALAATKPGAHARLSAGFLASEFLGSAGIATTNGMGTENRISAAIRKTICRGAMVHSTSRIFPADRRAR